MDALTEAKRQETAVWGPFDESLNMTELCINKIDNATRISNITELPRPSNE